jgi:hypothetical protein
MCLFFNLEKKESNLFGVGAAMQESFHAFVIGFSFNLRNYLLSSTCEVLLSWWQFHEKQFPNVCFLAKQILGIIRSQIKIECVPSFIGLLIALQSCCILGENLDWIIIA